MWSTCPITAAHAMPTFHNYYVSKKTPSNSTPFQLKTNLYKHRYRYQSRLKKICHGSDHLFRMIVIKKLTICLKQMKRGQVVDKLLERLAMPSDFNVHRMSPFLYKVRSYLVNL